ncbi:major capsid protein [Glaciimonas immobilis]|uniref:Methyltransferase n=1 Tax=Glaciimonas immobilis TaxID=728004 RepID=A0A840RMG7_9BURK|nr:major capsid protein [Glaciimonas immobilis]KAF3999445.1 methyltransferase [Glaciimonas immobilis]MBB5198953.1 hypothetical protein [Glaciimonas immobilis]
MTLNKLFSRAGIVVASTALAGASMADTVDVTAITGAGTNVALVGAAVFGVFVGVKLYKWIRAAL